MRPKASRAETCRPTQATKSGRGWVEVGDLAAIGEGR
jgi:hypothetical protein